MGIDIEGSMIIGITGKELDTFIPDGEDDLYKYAEELGLDCVSPYFDCDPEDCIFGYELSTEVEMHNLDKWVKKVKAASVKFEQTVGIVPRLYATQNMY